MFQIHKINSKEKPNSKKKKKYLEVKDKKVGNILKLNLHYLDLQNIEDNAKIKQWMNNIIMEDLNHKFLIMINEVLKSKYFKA